MVTQSLRGTVACPHCGDMAPRVKRTLRDRVVNWFTPIKRYRCDYCDWTETFAAAHTPANEVPGGAAEQASTP